ncbi:MAG: hypothetical protein ACR2HP_17590 [Ilumatobacteraceae bacterium]
MARQQHSADSVTTIAREPQSAAGRRCLADFGFGPLPDPRDPAVADGYWLLIEPLSTGAHTISVRSTIAPDTTIDVTYNITVGNVRD